MFVQRLRKTFLSGSMKFIFCIDVRIKWDWMKYKIREESISFSKMKAQERRRKIETIEIGLQYAKRELHNHQRKENLANLESAKAEYKK